MSTKEQGMAGTKIACRGCGRPIEISRVNPREDDTVPWRATVPPRHTVLHVLDDLVYFRCSTGDSYAVQPPQRGAVDDPRERKLQILEKKIAEANDPALRRALEDRWRELADPGVEHETWLEYHDRLVREYFDGERELLKEIYPEKGQRSRTPIPRHVRQARAGSAGFAVWAVVSFAILDWTSTAVIAVMWAAVFFTMYRVWSRRI